MEISLTHVIAFLALQATILIALITAVVKLAMKLAALETKMEPFWTWGARRIAESIHQPHPEWARMDALIEEFMNNPSAMSLDRLTEAIEEIHKHYDLVKSAKLGSRTAEETRDIVLLGMLDYHKRDRELRNLSIWKRLWLGLLYLFS